jgi:hypothetical protein
MTSTSPTGCNARDVALRGGDFGLASTPTT